MNKLKSSRLQKFYEIQCIIYKIYDKAKLFKGIYIPSSDE